MAGAIYFTGVAGVGKSSVLAELERSPDLDLKVFSYSEHLGAHLGRSREEMRSESSAAVGRAAVEAVDIQLARFVEAHRTRSLVVVDSHAVTDEDFGNRTIPFKPQVLSSLRLDAIFCLVADPRTIATRIACEPAGRPQRSVDQISRAQALQEAVAVGYAVSLGVPLYSIDADASQVEVARSVERAMRRATRA